MEFEFLESVQLPLLTGWGNEPGPVGWTDGDHLAEPTVLTRLDLTEAKECLVVHKRRNTWRHPFLVLSPLQ